jgi:hypothetical protein
MTLNTFATQQSPDSLSRGKRYGARRHPLASPRLRRITCHSAVFQGEAMFSLPSGEVNLNLDATLAGNPSAEQTVLRDSTLGPATAAAASGLTYSVSALDDEDEDEDEDLDDDELDEDDDEDLEDEDDEDAYDDDLDEEDDDDLDEEDDEDLDDDEEE